MKRQVLYQITGDWFLVIERDFYAIAKMQKSKNKKAGKLRFFTYHATIEQALDGYIRILEKETSLKCPESTVPNTATTIRELLDILITQRETAFKTLRTALESIRVSGINLNRKTMFPRDPESEESEEDPDEDLYEDLYEEDPDEEEL